MFGTWFRGSALGHPLRSLGEVCTLAAPRLGMGVAVNGRKSIDALRVMCPAQMLPTLARVPWQKASSYGHTRVKDKLGSVVQHVPKKGAISGGRWIESA